MIQTTLRALALAAGIALPAHADTIAVAAPWEFSSLDPAVAGYAFLRMAAAETLVEVDDDGALAPASPATGPSRRTASPGPLRCARTSASTTTPPSTPRPPPTP